MSGKLRIDFVSDVSCPWCAIGLKSLEAAIDKLGVELSTEVHLQPFELNPGMPREGQDVREHLIEKYGLTAEQYAQSVEAIRIRGEEVGFTFAAGKRSRIYNTFDAHRLLHWAELEGVQSELGHALFKAYFTDGDDPSSHETLARLAEQVGLDPDRAGQILSSAEFSPEVRARESHFLKLGVNAVPSIIVHGRQLIRGAQQEDRLVQVLGRISTDMQDIF